MAQVQVTGPDTVLYGAPVLLRAQAVDADGAAIDGVSFDWQVDSTSRAQGGSVDESGRLSYATRSVTTLLSVHACAITTTFCAVKSVTARDSFSISTPKLPTAITIGDSAQPAVTVVSWRGDTVSSEHPVVMTTGSTDSSGTAVVDPTGVVHVVGFGHVDLVARLFRHDTVIAESFANAFVSSIGYRMSIVGPDSVRVGESAKYSAPLISASGDTVRNVRPRWTTDGPTSAATIDSDGVLRPLTWGWMNVNATYGELGLAMQVRIKLPGGSRLILAPHTAQVPSPGRWKTPFTAQTIDSMGVPITPQPDPILHALDPLVANWRIIECPGYQCAKTDTIVAPDPGSARFSATFDDLADTAVLVINTDPNPVVVTITPHTLYENMRYIASPKPFYAEARDPTTGAILQGCCTWVALDPTVATVSDAGSYRYVTGLHDGVARIRAWHLSGSDTAILIVDRSLPSLGFGLRNRVAEGDSLVGGVTVVDGYQVEHPFAEAGALTIYGSNTSILEIRPNGTIGGLSPGNTSLYLRASALRPGLDSTAWEFEVDSLARVVEVSGSAASGCALDRSSRPACWISLSTPLITAVRRTTFEPPLHNLTTVTSSASPTACALSPAGEVYCWTWGRQDLYAPTKAFSGVVFQSLSSGGDQLDAWHGCGLTADGSTQCWGGNAFGQLGIGSTQSSATPLAVSTPARFVSLAAGADFTCGLATDGRVFCWGSNAEGQLGQPTSTVCGTSPCSQTPMEVPNVRATLLAAGSAHVCVATATGRTICWGEWLGDQTGQPPTVVNTNLSFSALAANGHDTCGLTSEGRAYCWGKNDQGQLGGSTTSSVSLTPVEVSGDYRFSAISAAGCGITTASVAICWGDGSGLLPKPITFHPY